MVMHTFSLILLRQYLHLTCFLITESLAAHPYALAMTNSASAMTNNRMILLMNSLYNPNNVVSTSSLSSLQTRSKSTNNPPFESLPFQPRIFPVPSHRNHDIKKKSLHTHKPSQPPHHPSPPSTSHTALLLSPAKPQTSHPDYCSTAK